MAEAPQLFGSPRRLARGAAARRAGPGCQRLKAGPAQWFPDWEVLSSSLAEVLVLMCRLG